MFVCKLRTPSCSHYEHFHVYLTYRRQTGNVVTRQKGHDKKLTKNTSFCLPMVERTIILYVSSYIFVCGR